jgi:serine/threonine protein kinase
MLPPDELSIKANILIDENCHARLADFGLLTIVSDPAIFTASSSVVTCGTVRWMSPELLHPNQFGLKDSRPTKESDCYALGMVTYEVLGGKPPFAASADFIVVRKVTDGERPERPEGAQGLWFTDDLWGMLNRCWAMQPKSRPGIEAVFECLEQVSKAWKPPPQQVDEDLEKDEDDWDLTAVVLPVCSLCSHRASVEGSVLTMPLILY